MDESTAAAAARGNHISMLQPDLAFNDHFTADQVRAEAAAFEFDSRVGEVMIAYGVRAEDSEDNAITFHAGWIARKPDSTPEVPNFSVQLDPVFNRHEGIFPVDRNMTFDFPAAGYRYYYLAPLHVYLEAVLTLRLQGVEKRLRVTADECAQAKQQGDKAQAESRAAKAEIQRLLQDNERVKRALAAAEAQVASMRAQLEQRTPDVVVDDVARLRAQLEAKTREAESSRAAHDAAKQDVEGLKMVIEELRRRVATQEYLREDADDDDGDAAATAVPGRTRARISDQDFNVRAVAFDPIQWYRLTETQSSRCTIERARRNAVLVAARKSAGKDNAVAEETIQLLDWLTEVARILPAPCRAFEQAGILLCSRFILYEDLAAGVLPTTALTMHRSNTTEEEPAWRERARERAIVMMKYSAARPFEGRGGRKPAPKK